MGPAVSDRERRRRRDGSDIQAADFGREGVDRHAPPPAALRGARPRPLSLARRRRRLHVGPPRRPSRRPRAHHRGAGGSRNRDLQDVAVARTRAGPARPAWRSRGPTPTRRRKLPRRSCAGASRWPGSWSPNGWSNTGASTPSADRRCPRRRTSHPSACSAWRGGAPISARPVSSRELVPLTLSAPPAGMAGAGRGAGSATELLSIWPTLVDKAIVDAGVRVVLEEVK